MTSKPRTPSPLRRLRRWLILLIIVYFFAGVASQKLIPDVDEIFPFFGWSLFSKVPDEHQAYTVLIHEQDGRVFEPPLTFLEAPPSLVAGDRYLGRKVIQKLGKAQDRGRQAEAAELRRLLEGSYLHGRVRYELIFERADPIAKWRSGEVLERRVVATFDSGEHHAPP